MEYYEFVPCEGGWKWYSSDSFSEVFPTFEEAQADLERVKGFAD
jgi:hypothetical protein